MRRICSVKSLKYVWKMLWSYADPSILNCEDNMRLRLFDCECYAPSGVCVENGVVQQIDDHLNEPGFIPQNGNWLGNSCLQGYAMFCGQCFSIGYHRFCQPIQLYGFVVKVYLSLVSSRQCQQIIDQMAQSYRFCINFLQNCCIFSW